MQLEGSISSSSNNKHTTPAAATNQRKSWFHRSSFWITGLAVCVVALSAIASWVPHNNNKNRNNNPANLDETSPLLLDENTFTGSIVSGEGGEEEADSTVGVGVGESVEPPLTPPQQQDNQPNDPMSTTSSSSPPPREWPQLVGKTGEEAKQVILKENPSLQTVVILPETAIVTMDYREDRVRIFVNDQGIVTHTPMLG